MAYVILDAFYPLLITRRVGRADAEAVEAMLAWVNGQLVRGTRKVGLVYDAGEDPTGRPDARARQVGGDWFRSQHETLRKSCAGIDFAFPSSLSRGAMTAVFWIAKPPVAYTMHGTSVAAIASSIARLGLVGVDPKKVVAELDELERHRI